MSGLDWVDDELDSWNAAGLLRSPRIVDSASSAEVVVEGRSVVLLCSNDYLGLADDHRVRHAAATAARRWGGGSGASRLVSGTSRAHRNLERRLADFEHTEDAVLFSSGYLANLGAITTLTGPGDAVFSDELNHASIVDACRLSKADVRVYRHCDVGDLERQLRSTPARRRVVVTDSVFSMDGDLAPLGEVAELCEQFDTTLVVDEAHATGVLGPTGAGAVEQLGVSGHGAVIVGTLSKALGSAGGYVATNGALATLLRNRARTHVFDTAPAPAVVAAADAALDVVAAEPWRRERGRDIARVLASELKALGLDARTPAAAIVPVLVGDARDAVHLSERLLEQGVFCPAIRPPSVPEGTSRLRVTVMATHTDDHIERVLKAFARASGRPRSGRSTARRRARTLFVTGTDTGVGKTVVTACLARLLTDQGYRVAVYKPLQTGTSEGAEDSRYVAGVSGCDPHVGVMLHEPLAPAVAAQLEGEDIDIDALVRTYDELRACYDVVLVEGAGGLLVPISRGVAMADLARAFSSPVLVVARPGLGTLSHTALTIEAARSRGLDVEGIALSAFPSEPGLAERTNPRALEQLCNSQIVGVVPHVETFDPETGRRPERFDPAPWLAPRFGGSFDRATFIEALDLDPVVAR